MRPVLCGLAASVFACQAAAAWAQQGTVQVSAAGQAIAGNPYRQSGENALEPDFGISWLQPGVRFGTFQIELRGVQRADRLHVGRNYAALRDLKQGNLSWTFEAGDAYFTRALGEYGFSNFTTPPVTFSGGVISARGTRGVLHVVGGRATAWRNIFGTDPDTMAQTLGMIRGAFKVSDRLDMVARVSRIRTAGLREFSFTIADGKQAGGGLRFTLTPAVQLIGDASVVEYRRLDSNVQQRDGSFLVGTNVLLSRGWIQVNAARFSPGEFPAMNDPLHDRETAFAAGEYDLWSRLRLFGGWEAVRTNINPDVTLSTSRDLPRTTAARGFGGVRIRLGAQSAVTLRVEEGDQIARAVRNGLDTESDTGARAAEWQSMFGRMTTYTRVSRRQNVDSRNDAASYTQDELSAQLFLRVTPTAQLFGLGTITSHESGRADGSSYWQLGGGAQLQLARRNLWLRGEAAASRSVNLVTREFVPRESFNLGMNGNFARGTAFSFNIAADRTPFLASGGTPWTTRSTFRVVQNFSTGAARILTGPSAMGSALSRARGTGHIVGSVYTDWNGNGTRDPDEPPLENIPVKIAAVSAVTTRRDGEFSFLNVPAGPQQVGLDTSAIPVDFDAPAISMVDIELDRGATRRVSFGLLPLGSVRGRVVLDANANGKADPGEEPINGAVLVLDDGARSEQVRRGTFRFDSIRSGDHVVSLIRESLPEGAVITGASQIPLALRRDQLTVDIDFAVIVQKRPETRKVFPPRGGAPPPAASARPAAAPARPPEAAATPVLPAATATTRPPTTRPGAAAAIAAPTRSGALAVQGFAVQIAALSDPLRARAIVRELVSAGYRAYVLAPGAADPDGPYRVRVGHYASRQAAAGAAATLERMRGEKLWVIRD